MDVLYIDINHKDDRPRRSNFNPIVYCPLPQLFFKSNTQIAKTSLSVLHKIY